MGSTQEYISISKTFPAKECCIYCGRKPPDTKLTQEHIIPAGLRGYLKIPNGSCTDCANITKKFEQICLRNMLGDARIHTGLGWGRKKEQPNTHTAIVKNQLDQAITILVPTVDHPFAMAMLELPPPRRLSAYEPGGNHESFKVRIADVTGDANRRADRVGGAKGAGVQQLSLCPEFFRLLAKIAHSYCAALATDICQFRPLLLPLIIEGNLAYAADLIGGADEFMPPSSEKTENLLHDIWISQAKSSRKDLPSLVVASIQLFKSHRMPIYQVIVGECQP